MTDSWLRGALLITDRSKKGFFWGMVCLFWQQAFWMKCLLLQITFWWRNPKSTTTNQCVCAISSKPYARKINRSAPFMNCIQLLTFKVPSCVMSVAFLTYLFDWFFGYAGTMHVHCYSFNFSFILVWNWTWTSSRYDSEQFPISPLWERLPHPDENNGKQLQ